MRNFQNTFKTRKRSFISAFSICMTVPLKKMVTKAIDILMITETRLDNSFPASQFLIQDFCTSFRLNLNKNCGGILLYIRSHVTSTHKCIIKNQIEVFFGGDKN